MGFEVRVTSAHSRENAGITGSWGIVRAGRKGNKVGIGLYWRAPIMAIIAMMVATVLSIVRGEPLDAEDRRM